MQRLGHVSFGTAVVFTGPTLAPGEARSIIEAIYLPPAAQGSVGAAVRRYRPDIILIIDGSFQGEPAIRHKEILWAVSRGIRVVGAASMGALRAAELFPHMQGVGLVYRWYRRFAFLPDDAVAVLHGPPDVNSAALTLAEIDLRMTFKFCERRGRISNDQRRRLAAISRRLNFRERTLSRIVSETDQDDPTLSAELLRTLESCFVEQKKRDALQALRMLGSGAFATPPAPLAFVLTGALARDLEDAGLSLETSYK